MKGRLKGPPGTQGTLPWDSVYSLVFSTEEKNREQTGAKKKVASRWWNKDHLASIDEEDDPSSRCSNNKPCSPRNPPAKKSPRNLCVCANRVNGEESELDDVKSEHLLDHVTLAQTQKEGPALNDASC
jgi:hypothetical protein